MKHYNSAKEKEDMRTIIRIFQNMSDMGKNRVYEELTFLLPTGYKLEIHACTLNTRDLPLNMKDFSLTPEDLPLKEED